MLPSSWVNELHHGLLYADHGVVGRLIAPKDVYILIPESQEGVVALDGKGDFADVIQLRVLRWGDSPGLSGWAQQNHKRPYNRKAGEAESEKGTC